MSLGTPLLTSEDVATYFNVDVVTVRRLVSRNELTAYRIGSEYRFMLQDVLDFLDRQRIAGNGSPSALSEAASDAATATRSGLNWEEHATPAARQIVQAATVEARQLMHPHVGSEHLLLAIVREKHDKASDIVRKLGSVDYRQVRSAVEFVVGQGGGEHIDSPQLTRGMQKILELAAEEAWITRRTSIGTLHLLLALCKFGKSPAAGVLEVIGVNVDTLQKAVIRVLPS